MRKIIAAINMTLDGYCDHTVGIADDELHDHYTEVLRRAGTLLYGRKTFELMKYWQDVVKNPTGEKAMDEFAVVMDQTPKIVFSHTLKSTDWDSAKLATRPLQDEVLSLRQQAGKDIFVGSPGLIATLTKLGLINEYQLCIHPIIAGHGLTLFKNINNQIMLELVGTKPFKSGAIVLYYQSKGE